MNSPCSIRWLTPDDVEAFRAIRLESIAQHPQAFGAYAADESVQPLEFFRNKILPHSILGAFDDALGLIGILGFRVNVGHKMNHKATLWGFYVRPDFQGCGVGTKLLTFLLEAIPSIAPGVEQLDLRVESSNASLKRFYERFGFSSYGKELRAVKFEGRYFDKEFMAKFL